MKRARRPARRDMFGRMSMSQQGALRARRVVSKPLAELVNRAPDAGQQPATLALRVEPGFGLDIQHMSGAIIERVNTHLGWRCVAKLAIRQEPLQRAALKRQLAPPNDPAARARA